MTEELRSNSLSSWRWFSLNFISLSFLEKSPCFCNAMCDNTSGVSVGRGQLKRDGTRAEARIFLSTKRTSPFIPAGASVQSTAGSQGVRISVSNAGYTTFRGSVRVLATHSIRQFPLHFPSRASPCATTFRTQYTYKYH